MLINRKIFLSTTFTLLILGTLNISTIEAQVVWENPKHEIYDFLSRQAQKGNIDFNDFIAPVSRQEIANHLATLTDSVINLSATEKKELAFYQKEYSEFNNSPDTSTFFKKDIDERWRFLSVKKTGFLLRGDPMLTFETTQAGQRSVLKKGNGLQFWGHAGKRFAFQFSFQDVTETGKGIDSLRNFTPKQGIVRTVSSSSNSLNYSELKGYISYSWGNGSLSIGKDNLLYGYGENGRTVLSDKAPAYPFIRLVYQPLKWLRFDYSHAWLQSNILDSASTYSTGNSVYGGKREIFISKYMASHSLNFLPVKGLVLSLGESIVYSDRPEIGYLIPIMFFKAYDHYVSKYNISAGSNGQFFFQASSRNHIPKTHLYSTLFIDEIRLSSVLDRQKSRNQLGFNVGASVTDILFRYLTLGAEYTRVNPFVYNNLIPAQNYASEGYSLGDWMGSNADRFMAYLKYTPLPKLKTTLQFQKVRKGSIGTIEDQYYLEPQPEFLNNLQLQSTDIQLRLSYEWVNNIYLQSGINWYREKNMVTNTNNNLTQFQFSLSFGL